ncbi:hypothetical protein [Streptomyces sp. NRRL S-337]|uniref:hypothetical protein n=1 Tax=Streptomyces sp. NRRL S-337 TaxID=1463900 RepID=UPI0004C78010|nr:hypothetical protein [Streptomyces sp. NRRL S-337]
MDQVNSFESPATMRLHRAEYLVGLAVSLVLFIVHIGEVRWLPAIILFAYIDLIGYIPGAIAYRRSPDKKIHKGFYVSYNLMHSLITQGAVAGLWIWLSGPEWALLVIPIHLFADRGIFGNFLKPFALPYEPVPNEEFARLSHQLFGKPRPAAAARAATPTAGSTQ